MSGLADWLSYVGSFSAVLLLLCLTLYLIRRVSGRAAAAPARRGKAIEVLDTTALGLRQRLVLVRVDDYRILLGVSQDRIDAIETWGRPLAPGERSDEADAGG
jgi:flagellar biosynthetic protein FliO